MINVKKDFQDLKYIKDFIKTNRIYKDADYIHRYDRQRLKSLLNEQIYADGIQYIFVKKE